MTITSDQARALSGGSGNVLDSTRDKIGGIGQIYLDNDTGQPSWVTVKTGLFGTSESFVPLENSTVDGDDVVVGYSKAQVKDAPRVDPDGSLSPAEEDELYRYYGLSSGTTTTTDYDRDDATRTGDATLTGGVTGRTETSESYTRDTGTVGHDTSGPTTDDAMTLSEERLRVGTRREEAGRARLRKYVTTENVTETVPVSREEVRVEREPITDANIGAATSGPSISEEEHEVVLHAERPVVEKEAVPVERVRLDTETVTEQVQVNEEVRKEELDVDTTGESGRLRDR